MIDLIFANLVPILGLAVALVGLVIFRLSRRDRPMAVVIVLVGFAFVALWFSAPEGAPPTTGTPSPGATVTPRRIPHRGRCPARHVMCAARARDVTTMTTIRSGQWHRGNSNRNSSRRRKRRPI